ncbi:2-aminoethylphosphonate--pyruvate transaminase [Clostridium sp.]|uniref:2-aminoethylphosphonate--pyruvate transaminase n=1 Tax=Clostridium sp. TaxID=1506 RepID=UPI003F34DD66
MNTLIPDNEYILLTPGPLSTSKRVREALLKDWCTWDTDYNEMVQDIRAKLLSHARCSNEKYTTVLMQGSGSFSVESVIGSTIGEKDKLLVLINGAYGKRIGEIASRLKINNVTIFYEEGECINPEEVDNLLKQDGDITHVAFVHCETTTGILNPLEELCNVVRNHNKTLIVDAMSSFGGIKIEIEKLGIDYLISSANKCIQGVPGFGFIIANRENLINTKGIARSVSLDLFDQWDTMEKSKGKWRFTSPTHTVRAFYEALNELEDEGGVEKRYNRYNSMQKTLVKGLKELGFNSYVKEELHSPIITTFLYPEGKEFSFNEFYKFLKNEGFVIYPGKLSDADTFRIGNIGDINLSDIEKLIEAIKKYNK